MTTIEKYASGGVLLHYILYKTHFTSQFVQSMYLIMQKISIIKHVKLNE